MIPVVALPSLNRVINNGWGKLYVVGKNYRSR